MKAVRLALAIRSFEGCQSGSFIVALLALAEKSRHTPRHRLS